MNKSEILQASTDMQAAFDKIMQAAVEYPSLLIYIGSDKEFAESFSSFTGAFESRLDFFRRNISKFADLVLSEQKKEKRSKAHEADKKKKVKKRGV